MRTAVFLGLQCSISAAGHMPARAERHRAKARLNKNEECAPKRWIRGVPPQVHAANVPKCPIPPCCTADTVQSHDAARVG